VVATRRKLAVLAQMVTSRKALWNAAGELATGIDQLEETRFLIDAVASASAPGRAPIERPRPIEERIVWVIDLFARLERRDQLQRSGL
jgi:phytoene synthase